MALLEQQVTTHNELNIAFSSPTLWQYWAPFDREELCAKIVSYVELPTVGRLAPVTQTEALFDHAVD